MTITEALAEIKTIGKRIEAKQQFVMTYLMRQDLIRDPFEKDGGSVAAVGQARQAIRDLQERVIELRRRIATGNQKTEITLHGQTRTVADWLAWRRDVARVQQAGLRAMAQTIARVRDEQVRKGNMVVPAGAEARPTDLYINVDERKLATEIEVLEQTLGDLDGQLSLVNATTVV